MSQMSKSSINGGIMQCQRRVQRTRLFPSAQKRQTIKENPRRNGFYLPIVRVNTLPDCYCNLITYHLLPPVHNGKQRKP